MHTIFQILFEFVFWRNLINVISRFIICNEYTLLIAIIDRATSINTKYEIYEYSLICE